MDLKHSQVYFSDYEKKINPQFLIRTDLFHIFILGFQLNFKIHDSTLRKPTRCEAQAKPTCLTKNNEYSTHHTRS